jgi:hypothetical protein
MSTELIVNISPHRSATKSFTAFCAAHGFRAVHWLGDDFDAAVGDMTDMGDLWALARPVLDSGNVFSDLPWAMLYPEVAAAYPEARFVLIMRSPRDWLASVRRHTDGRWLSHLERLFYAAFAGRTVQALSELTDRELLDVYQRFLCGAVRDLGPRLGVFDLGDAALGPKLAAWLGFAFCHPFERVEEGALA